MYTLLNWRLPQQERRETAGTWASVLVKEIAMKEILLTQGFTAIIDDEDEELISQHSWYAKRGHNGKYYARTTIRLPNGKQTTRLMHRLILGPQARHHTDHKNGNSLDNRRDNIRPCTNSQNQANRPKRVGVFSSRYKGVSSRDKSRWTASVMHEGKQIHIGIFCSEIEAAYAYDAKIRELFGEFAFTNFPSP
jgi:hypothetical protein